MMRIAFLLPGLHAIHRGAEVAFRSIATELALRGHDVTLYGSGPEGADPYRYVRSPAVSRRRFESWPAVPPLRNHFRYEELTWIPGMIRRYRPSDHDVAVTCSYPFTNWLIRWSGRTRRPANVFVTQNGDWPAFDRSMENRLFDCDGLVCTNREYLARNETRWPSVLIPNGVDLDRFAPGQAERDAFGLPPDRPVVLVVSALDATKRVREAVEVVARLEDAVLVVAGDGEERAGVEADAGRLLPGRFVRLDVESDRMPALYRSADVVLHMTLAEPFGNVYVEAMATGVPIVAHASPHTEWVLGPHGALVDTACVDDTAAAVAAAIETGPLLASREDVAERFAWPRIADQYLDFFGAVLDGKAGVPHA